MFYSTSVRFWSFLVLIIWSVTSSETCAFKTGRPRYTRIEDDRVNAALTFSITNCHNLLGVRISVTKPNESHNPTVCQFLKQNAQYSSTMAGCTFNDRTFEFSITRTIKSSTKETWRFVGELEDTTSPVTHELFIDPPKEETTSTYPLTYTRTGTADLDKETFSDSHASETTAAIGVVKDKESKQREAVEVPVSSTHKMNDGNRIIITNSSGTPDLFNFILIGAIGGFFVIIIALLAILFAVLFRKREQRRTRRRRDDVPTAPPIPCQFRRRHPVLEPTVVFTQRPLPDPLSPPPTPPPQHPALPLQRQQSGGYTPLGETEHFYFRIPERKSDSSTRSCKTASSLTSVEDSSGGYMRPPSPRSLNGEAEGAAASADATTTVAESSDYLHPL